MAFFSLRESWRKQTAGNWILGRVNLLLNLFNEFVLLICFAVYSGGYESPERLHTTLMEEESYLFGFLDGEGVSRTF